MAAVNSSGGVCGGSGRVFGFAGVRGVPLGVLVKREIGEGVT